jgi:alpha-tubulin suppressor-like RCC1 family protein
MDMRPYLVTSGLLLAALACRDVMESPTEPASARTQVDLSTTSTQAFWQVSAGGSHTCGVTTDNQAYCWGFSQFGQLGTTDGLEPCGHGGETCSLRLLPIAGGFQFRQVSAGWGHTCGITTDYVAYCWGLNLRGNLGDGTQLDRPTPTRVAGSSRFRQIDAGQFHTCARSYPENYVYCWGEKNKGQLGDGTTTDRPRPVRVLGDRQFRQVTVGDYHTCGVTSANQVFCWGWNQRAQLGDGTQVGRRARPTLVAGGHLFRQADAGRDVTCAVTTDNRAFCWGDGRYRQLGSGQTGLTFRPRAVAGDLSFRRVTAGGWHVCGETTTDRAYCWGTNINGGLGTGALESSTTPVAVAGGLRFGQLSVGEAHTCGKTTAAMGYCWGENFWGELGDGTRMFRLVPTPVVGPM